MKIEIFPAIQEEYKIISGDRHNLHSSQGSHRPLSNDYEYVGLIGEHAFSQWLHMEANIEVEVDKERKTGGDRGVDFQVGKLTIDVKTARKPFNLIVEKGKNYSLILVLAGFEEMNSTQFIDLIGWEFSWVLKRMQYKDFGYGVINYYLSRDHIRPLFILKQILRNEHEKTF